MTFENKFGNNISMEKVLSIIIPSYNMELYLERCLSSMISVSPHFLSLIEVIVVNDGSKDRTSAIAHSFHDNYGDSVVVIDKENGNYGSCINRGLMEATGKYVKVIDADDMVLTESLEHLVQYLLSADADLVITNTRAVTNTENRDTSHKLAEDATFSLNDIPITVVNQLHMHSITYRLSILRDMNYKQTEGISYTDLEWSFYPMSKVSSVTYLKDIVYVYNMTRTGQTVDENCHCRNMWMENSIISRMIELYPSIIADTYPNAKKFVHNRFYCSVLRLYNYYLQSYYKTLNINDLISIDKLLYLNTPTIYEEIGRATLHRKCFPPFAYVSSWRRQYKRNSILYSLYDFYVMIAESIYRK